MKDTTNQAGVQMMNSHKRIHEFSIDKNGYTGEFSIKYPSLMERMRIGTLRARYLGDMLGNVDVYTDNIAYMAATLETLLVQKPKWFNLEALDDYGVLEAVYEEYLKWANSFRGNAESNSNEENSRAGANAEALEDHEAVPDAGQR